MGESTHRCLDVGNRQLPNDLESTGGYVYWYLAPKPKLVRPRGPDTQGVWMALRKSSPVGAASFPSFCRFVVCA